MLAATLLAIGGPVPAVLPLAAVLALHVVRTPDRLLDAAYVLAFCGIGYLAG